MLWINFLHLYQPANVDGHVIKESTEKSYWRIIRAIEEHPDIKFTLNITGCLFLRWDELDYQNLIERIAKLVRQKKIELTGSAAYHPLLPLIPKKEAIKQIEENEQILKKYISKDFKAKGFFLPEAAYSKEVAKIVKKMGYEWLMLDEISLAGKLNQVDFSKIYIDKNSGLKIIFRNRQFSKSYVPETILNLLESKKHPKIIITATDGELYGLRHEDPDAILEMLLKKSSIKTLTFSEFIQGNKKIEKIKLISSNWESTEEEISKKQPFALWVDKKNKIQNKLWQLANLAHKTLEKNKDDQNYQWARWHLVRGLASCTFWWASAKDFRLFGPISWSPDEIERGANELIRSVRALENEKTKLDKIKAEKLYIKIKKMIWQKHWNYYWKK